MKQTVLFLSIIPFFILVYFFQQKFLLWFGVTNIDFAQNFYLFISLVSLIMLSNLILIYYFKQKYVGLVFLSWSMLKIMLVMGYFVYFRLIPIRSVSNVAIYYIVSVYFLYLFYEVFFGIFLLKNSGKTVAENRESKINRD